MSLVLTILKKYENGVDARKLEQKSFDEKIRQKEYRTKIRAYENRGLTVLLNIDMFNSLIKVYKYTVRFFVNDAVSLQ